MSDESHVYIVVDGQPYGTLNYEPVQADGYMDHIEGIRRGLALDVGAQVRVDRLEDDGNGGYRLHLDIEGKDRAVAHIPFADRPAAANRLDRAASWPRWGCASNP